MTAFARIQQALAEEFLLSKHDFQPVLLPLWAELAHHLNDTDLAPVQENVADIQRRIERFGRGFGANA